MSKVILSIKLKGGGEPALTGEVKGRQYRDTPTQPWFISHPALQEKQIHGSTSTFPPPGQPRVQHNAQLVEKNPQINEELQT